MSSGRRHVATAEPLIDQSLMSSPILNQMPGPLTDPASLHTSSPILNPMHSPANAEFTLQVNQFKLNLYLIYIEDIEGQGNKLNVVKIQYMKQFSKN